MRDISCSQTYQTQHLFSCTTILLRPYALFLSKEHTRSFQTATMLRFRLATLPSKQHLRNCEQELDARCYWLGSPPNFNGTSSMFQSFQPGQYSVVVSD